MARVKVAAGTKNRIILISEFRVQNHETICCFFMFIKCMRNEGCFYEQKIIVDYIVGSCGGMHR